MESIVTMSLHCISEPGRQAIAGKPDDKGVLRCPDPFNHHQAIEDGVQINNMSEDGWSIQVLVSIKS